jgi:2-C-methyl-D-erythritol 4-phosphate cytidylyltransferase
MKSLTVVITAGGIGKRMGVLLPKQFIEIADKPILIHTLEKFHSFAPEAEIIITLPAEWKEHWKVLLSQHNCSIPHKLVDGGEERYHSVKNAVLQAKGEYIMIHDGVRPLVSEETLDKCLKAVQTFKAVVPVLPIKESLRRISGERSSAVERSDYRLVQTPQCFSSDIITKAYEHNFHSGITDDASLVEEVGFQIHLVEGNEENIKITNGSDLLFAEAIFNRNK